MPLWAIQLGFAIYWLIFLFAFGACAGSLINVLVYRMPRGISVVTPPSACPKCGTRLRWRDNIPVFGWILLRGRCRYCQAKISPEYPIVEAIVGLMFAAALAICYLIPPGFTLVGAAHVGDAPRLGPPAEQPGPHVSDLHHSAGAAGVAGGDDDRRCPHVHHPSRPRLGARDRRHRRRPARRAVGDLAFRRHGAAGAGADVVVGDPLPGRLRLVRRRARPRRRGRGAALEPPDAHRHAAPELRRLRRVGEEGAGGGWSGRSRGSGVRSRGSGGARRGAAALRSQPRPRLPFDLDPVPARPPRDAQGTALRRPPPRPRPHRRHARREHRRGGRQPDDRRHDGEVPRPAVAGRPQRGPAGLPGRAPGWSGACGSSARSASARRRWGWGMFT
jgi:hypothetical protein